jgi:hypothetical protein
MCKAPFVLSLVLLDTSTAKSALVAPSTNGAPKALNMQAVEKDTLCMRCLDHCHYRVVDGKFVIDEVEVENHFFDNKNGGNVSDFPPFNTVDHINNLPPG